MNDFLVLIQDLKFENPSSTNFIKRRANYIDDNLKLEDNEFITGIYGSSGPFLGNMIIRTTKKVHLFLRKKVFVVHLHEATFNPGMFGQTNVTVPIEGKMKMHITYMAYENLEDPVRQPVHFDNTPKEDLTDPIEIERETPKAQDTRSLAEKLKEIKELLDENIINEEEFEKLKKEIMDNR